VHPVGRRLAVSVTVALVLAASPVAAQPPAPLGGLAADLRFISATIPTGSGWTPDLPAGGVVPGRGFGAEAGAHAFVGPGRTRRLTLGVAGLIVQGRTTAPDRATVTTRMASAAPHIGMGFGHRDGWSYLSIGAGVASVRSSAPGAASSPSPWELVFHYGGGARWFLAEHIAISLDLRFWALTPRSGTGTRPNAAATTRIAFGAGLTFR
jgi:opacity protein-like surface antigen